MMSVSKGEFMFRLIILLTALILVLSSPFGANAETSSSVAILCPCTFEPQTQTHGMAKFEIVFNEVVEASGPIAVQLGMLNHLDFSSWQTLSAVQIESLPYSDEAQSVEVRLPKYAFSTSATGYPGLLILNATDDTFVDGAILSVTQLTIGGSYGLSSLEEPSMMFLTEPEFAKNEDSAEFSVSSVYAPSLAGQSETLEFTVSAGKDRESFFVKGSAFSALSYDAEGFAQIEVSIPLTRALDDHLSQDPSKTDLQVRIKREDNQVLVYWVGSLASNSEPPTIGAAFSAPDTIKDSDADGISDFNEGLLGSDPGIFDTLDAVGIEMVYTYGKTATDLYGQELDARILFLHEAANAIFAASGAPVELVDVQRVNVGDDRGQTADEILTRWRCAPGCLLIWTPS